MKDNNEGFTLVELIVTIVLLTLVASIGTYSVISIINNNRKESYTLLFKNIDSAAETYYQECRYSRSNQLDGVCNNNLSLTGYEITLGELVQYGFLVGNAKDDNDNYIIVDPKSEQSVASCKIEVGYLSGDKISVNYIGGTCPDFDYLDDVSSEALSSSNIATSNSNSSSSSKSSSSSSNVATSESPSSSTISKSSNLSSKKSSSSSSSNVATSNSP